MNTAFKIIVGTAIFALICSLVSCSPIDDYKEKLEAVELKIQEKAYAAELDRAIEHIKTISTNEAYQTLVAEDEIKTLHNKGVAFISSIHLAATALRSLEDYSAYDKELLALRAYEALDLSLSTFNSYKLTTTRDYIFYADVAKNMGAVAAEIEEQYNAFKAASFILSNRINKAKEDHPAKTERLLSFSAHIKNLDSDYQSLLSFLSEKKTGRTPDDFRNYLKTYRTAGIKKSFPIMLVKDYEGMIFQLDKSYSKILIDMEEYHEVSVGMVSWDDYYDYSTEHTIQFPMVAVTYPTYLRALSEYNSEREYSHYHIKESNLLDVITDGKIKTSFPRGDDTANVWIEDSDSEYTQSFVIVENGISTEIEESVSRDVYLKHIKDEGLEILSKPYGHFEDEVIDQAQPPGAAMVGNAQYGSWKTNPSTGMQFWEWYAMYSIFDSFSDQRYDRGYYNDYSRRMVSYTPPYKRPDTASTNAYGVASKDSTLQKSLARSKSVNSSLRGSGASFRNKGPGKGK